MKKMTNIQIAFTLLLCAAVSVNAAKTSELKFTKQTELPNLGLSIKLMSNANAVPISPPSVFTYTRTSNTGATDKLEKYDPWALWNASQHGGKWVDTFGNVLTIAKITCPAPPASTAKHVTRAEFTSITTAAQSSASQWNDPDLRAWAKAFTKSTQIKSERMKINSFKIKDVSRFYIDNDTSQSAYAFKLNKSAAGQSRAADTYYFFHVQLTKDADPKKATSSLHSYFIKSIQGSKQQGSGTRTVSTKFQTKTGSALQTMRGDKGRSAEFIESRNLVANSIRNFKDWWFVNTDNYIILSNLSIKHKVMVKEIQVDIEYLRKAYAKLVPTKKDISAVSVLRVFATSEAYKSYVGPNYEWSGGLWMPSKKEMVIRPIDWGKNKQQREVVKKVTAHEAFHQYIFYALDQTRVSVWFNEGHAELFCMSDIKNKRLELKEDERKVEMLLKMIAANSADTEALFKMDYADFYSSNEKKRSENYTLAWAVVYYLRKGASLDRPASHAKVLDNYLAELWKTKDCRQATSAAFSATNAFKFQQDFLAFWKSKSKRSSARRNKIFSR